VAVDPGFLKTQWEAFSSAPVPAMLFLAVGAVAAWWLKSTVAKGQIDALKEKHAVLEERASLAAAMAQPTIERAVETDEKGNVKPPAKPSEPDISNEAPVSALMNSVGLLTCICLSRGR
jgi:hypothetical protein